jgi:aldose 1-epimerase
MPLRHGEVPADWLHTEPRAIARSRLDNCFTGWNGRADIQAGPAGLRIEASEAFSQLQVFTPSWADFFCVEPVSHSPDAINRPDLPANGAMHVLEPNETLSGTIRLCATGEGKRIKV